MSIRLRSGNAGFALATVALRLGLAALVYYNRLPCSGAFISIVGLYAACNLSLGPAKKLTAS